MVSGVQVGITLTSLGLNALGESTLASILTPLLANIPGKHTVALIHAVSLVSGVSFLTTAATVVAGRDTSQKHEPAAQAERVALLVAPPFQWYLEVFRPAISLLDGASRWVLSGLGFPGRTKPPPEFHSAEELQIQIQQARERERSRTEKRREIYSWRDRT